MHMDIETSRVCKILIVKYKNKNQSRQIVSQITGNKAQK